MGQELFDALRTLGGLGTQQLRDLGILPLFSLMAISLASSLFISFLYVVFYKSRATGSEAHRGFPLIGVSITAIFISIQFSLPLSLGLLGALSIVRFRTPIKEPEEIGFILLVVATSLSAATFNLQFLAIVLTIGVIAVLALRMGPALIRGRLNDGMFTVTLSSRDFADKFDDVRVFLEQKMPEGRIDSVTEHDEESTLSYSFIRLPPAHIGELHAGIKEIVADSRSSLYFNRSGEV